MFPFYFIASICHERLKTIWKDGKINTSFSEI